jgi:hypothetical protein
VTETLEDEDRPTADERFGPLAVHLFFQENPASLVETDFYLIAPSVPVQSWSFNFGFVHRPDLLVTDAEFVGTDRFYNTFASSDEEFHRILASYLQIAFMNSVGVMHAPTLLVMGVTITLGPFNINLETLELNGYMNPTLWLNPLAVQMMYNYLDGVRSRLTVEARAFGIHFVDQGTEITSPDNGQLTNVPGGRYRIHLDKNVFLARRQRS